MARSVSYVKSYWGRIEGRNVNFSDTSQRQSNSELLEAVRGTDFLQGAVVSKEMPIYSYLFFINKLIF